MATSTTSLGIANSLPLASLAVTVSWPSAPFSMPVAPVFLWIVPPAFLMARSTAFTHSGSMPGSRPSVSSMTVNWEPRRWKTVPSSRPMTPPPMTVKLAGTQSMSSASR